jgi:NADPH-dependent 2,4-dienoyl-CoA reductase/sulfur reductase-like enzyme
MPELYDVLVIGGGPAGMAAATVAAEAGKRTALIESRGRLGGQIWRGLSEDEPKNHYGRVAIDWLARFRKSGADLVSHAAIFAAPSPGTLWAELAPPSTAPRTLELEYKRLVLATGARELFLPFPGWTLPNVVGPGGLEAMAKEGWPVAGKRVVVAGSGPLVLAAADGLKRHGAKIVAVAEQAPLRKLMPFALELLLHPSKLLQGAAIRTRLGVAPYHTGCWPTRAHGTERLQSVTLTNRRRSWNIECDYLACAFGLVPNIELPQMLGCTIAEGFVKVDDQQRTSLPNVYAAGELTGIGGSDAALVEGQIAGLAAAQHGVKVGHMLLNQRTSWKRFASVLQQTFSPREELKNLAEPDTIICRCEDVCHSQLVQAQSWRNAKLRTRCGMGPCQGRICGAATSFLYGWTNDSIRPPQIAVSVGSLAGP